MLLEIIVKTIFTAITTRIRFSKNTQLSSIKNGRYEFYPRRKRQSYTIELNFHRHLDSKKYNYSIYKEGKK